MCNNYYAKCVIGGLLAELAWCHASHALEELGEKGLVGEIHVIADASDGLFGVKQVNFDACDQRFVNPLFCASAACLLNHCAQVTWCDAQSRRIELDGVVFGGKFTHQMDEIGEQTLLA